MRGNVRIGNRWMVRAILLGIQMRSIVKIAIIRISLVIVVG